MNIAVITGASSELGRELIAQLPRYASVDEVWAIARKESTLEELKKEASVPIRAVCLDLLDSVSFVEYTSLLEKEKPNVKLLVNAAGLAKFGDYDSITVADDCKMIDLNCKALVLMTRLTLPYMTTGGHILQMDSLSAFQPVPYITTYGATKSFVLSYSRSINQELKPKGIRVMAMNPGRLKTAAPGDGEDVKDFIPRYSAKEVVTTGLHDLYRTRKDYSLHGLPTKGQVRLVKFIPHNIVMNIWLNRQKKGKKNEE